ncbi:Adenylyltransferase and sulfurtransferase MOCS3 [Sarracenia purpurea var. burkii]
MELNRGEETSKILSEIENLKFEKSEIDRRISVLEAQLRDRDESKTISTSSCPPLSNGYSVLLGHGLSPDMIYRYSRHLLLPSFGVQGDNAGNEEVEVSELNIRMKEKGLLNGAFECF